MIYYFNYYFYVKCYFIVGVIALRHLPTLLNVDVDVDLNIAKIRRFKFCMEARKLCPPETFSVINHNQKKLLETERGVQY